MWEALYRRRNFNSNRSFFDVRDDLRTMRTSATDTAPIDEILKATKLILDYTDPLNTLLTKAYTNTNNVFWPDIIRIMHISDKVPKGNMPYQVDADGGIKRGDDGSLVYDSANEVKKPTEDAEEIADSLLETDRQLFLAKTNKTEDLAEMQAIQNQRICLAQLVSRLFGYKGS